MLSMCFPECGAPGGSFCPLSGAFAPTSVVEAQHYRLFRSLAASPAIPSLGAIRNPDTGCLLCTENVKPDPPAVPPPPYTLWLLLHREHLFFKSHFYLLVHQEKYKYTQPPIITPCEDTELSHFDMQPSSLQAIHLFPANNQHISTTMGDTLYCFIPCFSFLFLLSIL